MDIVESRNSVGDQAVISCPSASRCTLAKQSNLMQPHFYCGKCPATFQDLVWSPLEYEVILKDFNFSVFLITPMPEQQRPHWVNTRGIWVSGAHYYSSWTRRLCNEKMRRMQQKKARKWPHCWGLAVQMWDRTHFCHEENGFVQHVPQYQPGILFEFFSVKRMSGGKVCLQWR